LLRRDFLAAGVAAALPLPAFAQGTAGPYDRILEAYLRESPESATSYGLDKGPHAALKHRLDDRSAAHRFGYFDVLADAGPAVAAAQRRAGSERDKAWLATLAWISGQARGFRRFAYGGVGGYGYPVAYVVSQVSGAYQSVPDFLDTQHTVETAGDAEAYLDRLAAFATVLDQETAHIRADAARGVAPPGFLIDRTVKQLSDLRADPSGLATSLGRRAAENHIAGDWQARARKLVDGPVAAALDRQIAAFKALRPQAREAAGVHALPDGRAYYAMCLGFHTSTSLTPDAAHDLGLAQVAEISARALAILRQQGRPATNAAAGIRALNDDPDQLFPNTDAGRAQVLDYIRGRVKDMYGRLPRAFDTLPKTPLEVRRVPPAIELGSPGAYSQSGSIDGSRPGGIYFNLHDTANWPRFSIGSTAYHEGVPGHHLQGSLANEAAGVPTLMKVLGFNAYNEGWALYAEQLADELGAYDAEPLGRLGMLQASLFRACRIVVDTGIHWKGWSREKAIAYLIDNAGETPDDARREIERYCAWPGQACGYKIGHLEFLRLRDRAKARMGPRFDLKGFHDAVLLNGAMPLEVLGHVVDAWAKGA
jgi:uncharacterized protein (DUF885 family)